MPPKKTTTTTTKKVKEEVKEAVAEPVVETTEVVVEKPKKTRTKKVKEEPVVEAVVEAPVVEEETTTEEPAEKTLESRVTELLEMQKTLMQAQKEVSKELTTILKEVRMMEKNHAKALNKAQTKRGRRRPREPEDPDKKPRTLSGIAKLTRISDELREFLGKPATNEDGTPFTIRRSEVSSAIHSYINDNNLKNKNDGRVIEPNDALGAVLGPAPPLNKNKPELGNGYSWFNLQTCLKRHFIKEPEVK